MTLDEVKSVFREHVPGVSIEDDGPGAFTAVIRDRGGNAFPGALKVTAEGAASLTLVEARALASNLHEAARE